MLFPELKLEDQFRNSLDSNNFKDLKDGERCKEGYKITNELVRNGGKQVNWEVSTDVLSGNLSSVSDVLTCDIDVTRIECDEHIKDEDEGNGRVNDFIILALSERLINILERHDKGIENGEHHDEHIPSSLVL